MDIANFAYIAAIFTNGNNRSFVLIPPYGRRALIERNLLATPKSQCDQNDEGSRKMLSAIIIPANQCKKAIIESPMFCVTVFGVRRLIRPLAKINV